MDRTCQLLFPSFRASSRRLTSLAAWLEKRIKKSSAPALRLWFLTAIQIARRKHTPIRSRSPISPTASRIPIQHNNIRSKVQSVVTIMSPICDASRRIYSSSAASLWLFFSSQDWLDLSHIRTTFLLSYKRGVVI